MRMKCWIGILLLILFGSTAYGEECRYIRVVSRDDSMEAQKEKMAVRDAVLPLLPNDPAELAKSLCLIENRIKEMADGRVEIREWAPPGLESAPSLYITLGAGEGPNWWGILYPNGIDMFSEDMEGEKTVFVWPLLERLAKWLGIG